MTEAVCMLSVLGAIKFYRFFRFDYFSLPGDRSGIRKISYPLHNPVPKWDTWLRFTLALHRTIVKTSSPEIIGANFACSTAESTNERIFHFSSRWQLPSKHCFQTAVDRRFSPLFTHSGRAKTACSFENSLTKDRKTENSVRFRLENSRNTELTRDKTENASAKHFLATGCPASASPALQSTWHSSDDWPLALEMHAASVCWEQSHSTSKYLQHRRSTALIEAQHREKRTTTSLARVPPLYVLWCGHRFMHSPATDDAFRCQTSTGSQLRKCTPRCTTTLLQRNSYSYGESLYTQIGGIRPSAPKLVVHQQTTTSQRFMLSSSTD